MKTVRSCGFLIVKGDPVESFLLMKHKDRWDLPKGHVDPGETDLQCALRELEEETGIGSKSITIDEDFRFEVQYEVKYKRTGNKPVQKTAVYLLATLTEEVEIVLTEHDGFEWVSWAPPHSIQKKTVDPLLAAVEQHLNESAGNV